MKKWLSLIALIFLAVGLAACGGPPQISVPEASLALGDVVNGEIVTREVTVQNVGKSDLIVEAVTTSCGCTEAAVAPMRIPSDGSGTLTVVFDSGAHGPELTGQLIRQVFIATNDPQQPEIVVELEANILPPSEP
jgi:hypothetical protein